MGFSLYEVSLNPAMFSMGRMAGGPSSIVFYCMNPPIRYRGSIFF